MYKFLTQPNKQQRGATISDRRHCLKLDVEDGTGRRTWGRDGTDAGAGGGRDAIPCNLIRCICYTKFNGQSVAPSLLITRIDK
ncbi:hypothetical protein HanIR_Chr04g0156161 [Helianthus annuus]|nr:hypothetical protein HanIR_Chr04g0156161 [Helianthus annuus]